MIKGLRLQTLFTCLMLLILASSCLGMSSKSTGRKSNIAEAITTNDPSTVNEGYGRYWADNPIILSGDSNLSPHADLSGYISTDPVFVTNDDVLNGDCSPYSSTSGFVDDCFGVYNDKTESDNPSYRLRTTNEKWAYDPSSKEFLQVHTFIHTNNIVSKFQGAMANAYDTAYNTEPIPTANYTTAIPKDMFSKDLNWHYQYYSLTGYQNEQLKVYANCDDPAADNNSFFNPASFYICLGKLSDYPAVKFAQDPTITYHEIGHTFSYIMFNTRNYTAAATPAVGVNPVKAQLGHLYYDEANAINEGISDYYSYAMNERTHFAEWALGAFLGLSRPISEDDSLHASGISTSSGSRLAYPTYLDYDAFEPDTPFEDIHYAGQIASHYLVALTEDLKTACSFSHATASKQVLSLLAETMAELGDLTATGADDQSDNRVNLDKDNSYDWIRMVNPPNFRNFFHTFAKYLYLVLNKSNSATSCNGTYYPKYRIEQLLDNYGLLMFNTYNLDGNDKTNGHSGSYTSIDFQNLLQTNLVSKEHLIYDPEAAESSKAWIFDSPADITTVIQSMLSSGQLYEGISDHMITTSDYTGHYRYNNGNGRISPGEIVGIALNLYNNSNVTIGGVQVLANDWDHTKNAEPCNTFEDQWPTISEGANATPDSNPVVAGDCGYITRDNGTDDEIYPTCFVQIRGEDRTYWANQDVLRANMSMEAATDCLGKSGKDCFIRSLKGADNANYSKIDPQKTWAETMYPNSSANFNTANIMFFEVNPLTPHGTTFHCRFRARFTNCRDCFADPATNSGDDYLDYEYSGGEPFKILDFQFTIGD